MEQKFNLDKDNWFCISTQGRSYFSIQRTYIANKSVQLHEYGCSSCSQPKPQMADTTQRLRFLKEKLQKCMLQTVWMLFATFYFEQILDRRSLMWNSQQVRTSDTGMINKPSYKAVWLWDESRCQAAPKMKSQRVIQNLSEQSILLSFLSLGCRCSKVSVCTSNGLRNKQGIIWKVCEP